MVDEAQPVQVAHLRQLDARSSSTLVLADQPPQAFDIDKHSTAPSSPERPSSRLPDASTSPSTPPVSGLRRAILLFVFSSSQFFDVYLSSASIIAITTISKDLDLTAGENIWLINSYSLTLAAFLLAAGRLADVHSAKWTFVGGMLWVGLFSLGAGLSQDKITLIVLRAFSGIGASATIPAALALIARIYVDDKERTRALSIFGGSGSAANVCGLILGGLLLLASWRWIYWLVTLVMCPGAIVAALLIPKTHDGPPPRSEETGEGIAPPAVRKPKMDLPGLFFLTAAIVLLIFGLSNGNVQGFAQAQTLAPLIIGLLLFPAFLVWETRSDPIHALIPPATWRITNFTLLTALSLIPFWYVNQSVFSDLFQSPEWGNTSAIMTAVRFLPNGISGGLVIVLSGRIPRRIPLKLRILVGATGSIAGTLLLSFASRKSLYWPLIFPGLLIGSGSNALVFATFQIALLLSAPPETAGVVGGVFNSSLQLGSSIGLSLATLLQVSFPRADNPAVPSWTGYRNSLYLSVACSVVIILSILVFFKDPLRHPVRGALAEEVVDEKEPVPHSVGPHVPPVQT